MDSKAAMYFKKYVVLFYGVCIQTFGIALSYHAQIGSGPIAVYNQGMNVFFGISVGTASWIMSIVFIALSLIFRSRYISVATIILTVGFGYMLDFWTEICGYFFPEVISLPLQAVCLVATTILTPAGIGIIISANAGAGSTESFLLYVNEKTHIPFKHLMLAVNVFFGVLGWFLGGTVGIATLTMCLSTGYISSLTTKLSSKTIIPLLGINGLAVD